MALLRSLTLATLAILSTLSVAAPINLEKDNQSLPMGDFSRRS